MRPAAFTRVFVLAAMGGLFGACGGHTTPPTTQSGLMDAQHAVHGKLDYSPSCQFAYSDAVGSHYAAQIGGGDSASLDYGATPCEIGIYIGSGSSGAVIDHTTITGGYQEAIFIDGAPNVSIDHTRIDGALSSGIFSRDQSGLSLDHTFIANTPIGVETTVTGSGPNGDVAINHTDVRAYTMYGIFLSHTNVTMQHSTTEPDGNADPGETSGSTEGFRFYYADVLDVDHDRSEDNHLDFHFICSTGEVTSKDLAQGHDDYTATLNECVPATPTPRFHPTPVPSPSGIS